MEKLNFKKKITDCSCNHPHCCNIDTVIIDSDACNEIPTLLHQYKKAVLVSDQNTFSACGEKVLHLLEVNSFEVKNRIFQTGNTVLIPNESALADVDSQIDSDTQVIIGVGSGVINDICKFVSFQHHIPYMIVATAPSMDGYASTGAALILNGMKVTLNGQVPTWIIGDINVLKKAPLEMIRSGVGDILGKLSCLNDWKISALINDEYFCPEIYDMVMRQVDSCRKDIHLYLKRDSDCIKRLTESLILVGIAMAYVGNSRPASGSEHHLSHFYEVINLMNHRPYFPHGIDVAYGTAVSCFLREKLCSLCPSSFHNIFDKNNWEKDIHRIYGSLAPEVINLQSKVGFYDTDRLPAIIKKWSELKKVLEEVPNESEILSLLNAMDYRLDDYYNKYGPELIRDSIIYAKDVKDRYSVLWLLFDIGLLSDFADQYVTHLRTLVS